MYKEAKTIEAATYLLSKLTGPGEAVPYIKLIKLLYLADREQVKNKGRTISGDSYWSLKCGPILSDTLNAIKGLDPHWMPYVGVDLEARVVWLKAQAQPSDMSRADRDVLDKIVAQFGHLPWQELVDFTHELPEWKRPDGQVKRRRIYLVDIARAVGHSEERVHAIVEGDKEKETVRQFLGQFKPNAKVHA
jgi:uncharacterized phage-associated protein